MSLAPRDLVTRLAAARGSAIVVPTMTMAQAWHRLVPDDDSVTCVGFMGGASSLGLGLALARPDRRVVVLDGDGSLLMQLGTLATIAGAAPRNLCHCVLRNRRYVTSGGQALPDGGRCDFAGLAAAAGYARVVRIASAAELDGALPALLGAPGPLFAELEVELIDGDLQLGTLGPPFAQQAEQLRQRLRAG